MKNGKTLIEEYLVAHPIARHDRILEPVHPACQVIVTIPLYKESENLIPLLHSFARQRGVMMDEFEVILIVNNSAEDVDQMSEAFRDNQKTLRMLEQLRAGSKVESPYPSDAALVEEIRASGLAVRWIDLSSAGRTVVGNNVGVARELGCKAAAERFVEIGRPEGLIVISDGDVEAYPNMVAKIVAAFEERPELVGGIGQQHCYYPQHDELATRVKAWFDIERVMQSLWRAVRPETAEPPLPKVVKEVRYEESCAVVRAQAWAAVGGFPQMAGGAGYLFGYRLAQYGLVEPIDATVLYPMRASERTGVHDGIGWQVVRTQAAVSQRSVMRRGHSFFQAHGQLLRALKERLSYELFAEQQVELAESIGRALYEKILSQVKTPAGFAADLAGYFDFRATMLEEIYPALDNIAPAQRIDTALHDMVQLAVSAGVLATDKLDSVDARVAKRLKLHREAVGRGSVYARSEQGGRKLHRMASSELPLLGQLIPTGKIDWLVERAAGHGESIDLLLIEIGLANQIPEFVLKGELLYAYVLAREVEPLIQG